jgi:hypothetical protein
MTTKRVYTISNHTYTVDTSAWTPEFTRWLENYAVEVLIQRAAASDKTDAARHASRTAKAVSLGKGERSMKGEADVVGRSLTAFFKKGLPESRHGEIPALVAKYRDLQEKEIPEQIRAQIMAIRALSGAKLDGLKL